ncbi:hypothetical protein KW796_00540 [Candidatus Parcubacteria bacterium]|nr:hypothetical protein [Candidatus Parcubacteria bacterium]
MKQVSIILGAAILAGGIVFFATGHKLPKPEAKDSGTGIMGEVRLGPTCPVQNNPHNEECADKPYQTDLILVNLDEVVIKRFSSGTDGKFKIDVPPGDYAIRKASSESALSSCGQSGIVPVEESGYTEVIVFCDTGIR